MLKLGELIRQKRRKAGLTQERLAEMCGVSLGYIGKIEIGLQEPGPKVIVRLMKILEIKSSEMPNPVSGELLAVLNELSDKSGELNHKFDSLHPRVKSFLLDVAPIVE
ncbi:MAG: helix-turn-helix transcriptional regulator, partial [bacterium]